MSYKERLHPWCIIRLLPNVPREVVGRFRHRPDAEARLKRLQQTIPNATYALAFDVPRDEISSTAAAAGNS